MNPSKIFDIQTKKDFKQVSLQVFRFQYQNNKVYRRFCNLLGRHTKNVTTIEEIPFLPIEFFKKEKIVSSNKSEQIIFSSSGTTGTITSKHYVTDLAIYEQSFFIGFKKFYGNVTDYCILALLPSYLERTGSSLIYMANYLIKKSNHPKSGFYLHNIDDLISTLEDLESKKQKTLLIGVSFALLDLIEKKQLKLRHTIVMETGGMKGRRKELIRSELHNILSEGFGTQKIHSEYGMTELLSQAYSKGDGVFKCPPWMKVSTRNTENPLQKVDYGKNGGINVIDLANINSCSFIATQDLGKVYKDGSFEILGRFDHSDIRGCNLLIV